MEVLQDPLTGLGNRRALLRSKGFSRADGGGGGGGGGDAAVLAEVAVLKRLAHRNVIRLFEVLDDPDADALYLVQEFCELGAVFTEKEYNHPLAPDLVRAYLRDVAHAPENAVGDARGAP